MLPTVEAGIERTRIILDPGIGFGKRFGDNLELKGGFAEYTVAPESALASKPEQLTFAEASTIPQSGAIETLRR